MKDTRMGGDDRRFPATSLLLLEAARSGDGAGRDSLERLLHLYWKPVYGMIRYGWRKSNEDAKDLTQSFFAGLLGGAFLERFTPGRGSFRAYLKAAVANFLRNAERDASTFKRGGRAVIVALDPAAVDLAARSADGASTPDEAFGRAWRDTIIALALRKLKERLEAAGRSRLYEILRRYDLEPSRPDVSYRSVADELGIPEGAVRKQLYQARREFRTAVADVVSETVDNEEDFALEMREFFGDSPHA